MQTNLLLSVSVHLSLLLSLPSSSFPLFLSLHPSLSFSLLPPSFSVDLKAGASGWRKAVPSYTQSSGGLEVRGWSSLPRDDSLEPLPLNWEMAYTETGMVYFIE